MKVYTAEEVAGILKVEYKTALRLIERGLLKALPGIRHKRITEHELNRYLDNREILSEVRATVEQAQHAVTGQAVVQPTGRSARTAANGSGVPDVGSRIKRSPEVADLWRLAGVRPGLGRTSLAKQRAGRRKIFGRKSPPPRRADRKRG